MKNVSKYIAAFAVAFGASCSDNANYGIPDLNGDCTTTNATLTFADLSSKASSVNTIYDGTADEVIEGYVVSSDEGGNFYKTLSVVSIDNSAGISLSLDAGGLFANYEPGRKIYVKLNGLNYERATSFTNGLNIGLVYQPATGAPRIGRIDPMYINQYVVRGCDKIDENLLVKKLNINQAKNDQYLNQLIEIDQVQFTQASLGHTYFDEALKTYAGATAIDHPIIDSQGNTLIVRVSEFANFASAPVATGNGKIRGVLTKYNNGYQFMIRTLHDVAFTNPREELEIENFENFDASKYQILKVEGTNDWYPGTFNGNRFLQARKAANTGNTVTYFVMPYDFNQFNKLSFQSLFGYMSRYTNPTYNPDNYNKPILKVYYSLNFDAQNPTTNLVDITDAFTYSAHSGTGWASSFTDSGVYTFNGVSGQGHIIFAYEADFQSNASVAETRPGVQLDNILFEK
ncbi:DUF5689 domain-containing protein [Flavobacterium agricola]|uniref:DUF5689 domain-containing protein n=1 Tax=Flavobacterium agricola TaxID=2870839 RepID=A0ABY6LXZ7_9FLAO|nr:DUF5689 domain-containing protein [Flavobacterium agricola]UYW01051.1 DUF5689 domain-containing protein [Flavobacterium agricola]